MACKKFWLKFWLGQIQLGASHIRFRPPPTKKNRCAMLQTGFGPTKISARISFTPLSGVISMPRRACKKFWLKFWLGQIQLGASHICFRPPPAKKNGCVMLQIGIGPTKISARISCTPPGGLISMPHRRACKKFWLKFWLGQIQFGASHIRFCFLVGGGLKQM